MNFIRTHELGIFFSLLCSYYACLCGHEDLVKYLLNNGKMTSSDWKKILINWVSCVEVVINARKTERKK